MNQNKKELKIKRNKTKQNKTKQKPSTVTVLLALFAAGHRRKVELHGCLAFEVLTNACRGYCESFAIPSDKPVSFFFFFKGGLPLISGTGSILRVLMRHVTVYLPMSFTIFGKWR